MEPAAQCHRWKRCHSYRTPRPCGVRSKCRCCHLANSSRKAYLISYHHPMKRSCAVSILEAVVVIACVAVPPAILLPPITRTPQVATQVRRMSNIRQLTVGWPMYNSDNNGNFPLAAKFTGLPMATWRLLSFCARTPARGIHPNRVCRKLPAMTRRMSMSSNFAPQPTLT